MAHPTYFVVKDGQKIKVPSVTTILGELGWSKGGLMYWAWKQGKEGKDLREMRDKAATVGTIAHAAVEAELRGLPFDLSALTLGEEEKGKVETALEAWKRWRETSRLELIESECSMVSAVHLYGGTMDAASVFGKMGIMDLKSSTGIYDDHLCQVRAYGELWNENHPDRPVEEYHILRIDKEDASFHHSCWPAPALDWAWDAFRAARDLYAAHKRKGKGGKGDDF